MKCEPTPKICPVCGETFLARNTKKVFCGELCCKKAGYRRRKQEKLEQGDQKACIRCGKMFAVIHPDQKYCSRACSGKDAAKNFGLSEQAGTALVRIRITQAVPVYQDMRPEEGRVYEAERHKPRRDTQTFYLIRDMNGTGKTLVVRDGECEEVT